ncbi:hypothetical protein ABZ896_50765 [Streptomyces sp. NPDC047072]|uniref:hypothetical protein n=1 Tax=Streptomyces sp. NPDC047072 TaxID=3154809 RepID=UPI0033C7E774
METWGQGDTDYAPNIATDRVARLCTELITRFHPLRSPMPLVVLRATPDPDQAAADEAVSKGVEFIRETSQRRGLRCRVVADDQDGEDFHRGLSVLRELAGKPWKDHRRPHSEPYVFARSELLAAVEEAATADDEHSVLTRLERMRWRPTPADGETGSRPQQALRTVLSPANLVGATLVAAIGAAAATRGWLVLGALAGLLLAVGGRAWARQYEGLLPWHGRAGRWLATTTFLATATTCPPVWSAWRPRLSRATRAARADEVAQIFHRAIAGPEGDERDRARQFYLQLRALALLDDLRSNFRTRPVGRARRHVTPPVVFIPRATRRNGGIVLLRVISDVRSRRSELDPLLVVAGLAQADEGELDAPAVVAPAFTGAEIVPDPTALYRAWVRDHLRIGQSPSVASNLPWVLPIRLPAELLTTTGTEPHDTSPLGPTRRLPGSPRLVAALAVLATLGATGWYVADRADTCRPLPLLHAFDRETVRLNDTECYGISDGGAVFGTGGVQLNGAVPGEPGTGTGVGAGWDLERLMERIGEENAQARSAGRHVVMIYAGEVTAEPGGDPATALNGLRELAGVYAKQKAVNKQNAHGTAERPKIVLLVANGAHGMIRQGETVDTIVDYVRAHREEVVGVVGLSRDRKDTGEAIEKLRAVGLPVLDPMNSDDDLEEQPNYFGLAATNSEEARAFRHVIGMGRVAGVRAGANALVLTPPGGGDPYSLQQAAAAVGELGPRGARLKVREESYGSLTVADLKGPLCDRRPALVYFTGRAEQLGDLGRAMKHVSCSRPLKVALLTGDDMTKTLAVKGLDELPGWATLHYAALAAPLNTLGDSELPVDIADALGRKQTPAASDPLFEDGTTALSYDAATLLYEATRIALSQPGMVARTLLMQELRGATGDFDLSPGRKGEPCGHAVALFRVPVRAGQSDRQPQQIFYGRLDAKGKICTVGD